MTFREHVDLFVHGKEIPPPRHSAIDDFIFFSNIRWAHLPLAGGWYNQHPDFVKRMKYMMTEKAKVDEEEAKKKEAEASRGKNTPRRRRR